MKNFGKYFTLTILLLLGVGCIGVLYLFFVPGSTLFNIKYISYNEKTETSFNIKDIHTLNVNSRSYEVKINSTENEDVVVVVYSNSFGFVTTKNSITNISSSIKDGILALNITEPHGFALPNSSYVEIRIPEGTNLNLGLTNKGADTSFISNKININNFAYTTTNGYLTLNNVNINGNLDLDINKATFKIDETVNTSNSNLKLKVSTGKFYANNSTFKNINIDKNERGVIEFKECSQLTENVSSAGGRISAETVSHVNVKSSGTNIYIKTITDGAIIELDSGDVVIDSLTGTSSTITTKSGNITVKEANSTIITKTDNGNINITNATLTVSVQTNYGDINVAFKEDAQSQATNNSARYLIAALKDGSLTASGIEKVSVKITDNGRANLVMQNVFNESSINANSGNVNVTINKDSIYKLTTESEGSVRVNLTQIPQYNGYTTKENTVTYVNCYENGNLGNSLNVKTASGNLTILDTNFA